MGLLPLPLSATLLYINETNLHFSKLIDSSNKTKLATFMFLLCSLVDHIAKLIVGLLEIKKKNLIQSNPNGKS